MNYLKATFSPKETKRIFAKISINPRTKCWEWIGSLDGQGYGLLWFKGKTERIHRVMFANLIKPIPKGKESRKFFQLDHLCKNKKCCNPKHLELVKQKINVLRSDNVCAINARKTHCKNGHPLSNKFRKNSHSRIYCRICDSIRHKNRLLGPNRKYWLNKLNEASKRYYAKHKHS